MAVKRIQVTQIESMLELDHPQIDLESGDVVEWEFLNLSNDHLAFICFDSFPPETQQSSQILGPFQSLESFPSRVVGIGNSGAAGLYSYTALGLGPGGAVVTSAGIDASINNLAATPDTSPTARVVFEPQPTPQLHITPHKLVVERTAIWTIEGLPEGSFFTFRFEGSPHAFTDPLKGPFSSISAIRGLGSSVMVVGTGLSSIPDSNPLGHPVHYLIEVRNAAGQVLATLPDPVIEPVGSPPTGAQHKRTDR